MPVTEEDVDDMLALFKLAYVRQESSDEARRKWVRRKLEQGKVPCFEQRRWVKQEKNDEVA